MLYNEKQINTIINNAIDAAGIADARINGVPLGHLDESRDFTAMGNLLTQPVVANDFTAALYNQFIYRATKENYFTSPFDYFRERRDGVAYGTYETDVQPIFPVPFDMKAFDRILDFWETPVITQYFAINRRDTFPQTITKAMIKDAFTSYEAFDNFLAKLIIAPRNGNVVIETNAVKTVINQNVASGAVKRTAFTTPSNEDDWKALAAEIVGVANAMTAEPSTKYNNYVNIEGSNGVESWAQSDKNDLVLIGDSEILAKLRTYVLAFAYNKEDINFNFKFIEVNTFNYASYDGETRKFGEAVESPIKLVLCDGGWLKFEDNFDEELSNTNAMTAGMQRALQIQQTIGIRVARNALVWIDSTSDMYANDIKVTDKNPVKYWTVGETGLNKRFATNDGTTNADTAITFVKASYGVLHGTQTEVEESDLTGLYTASIVTAGGHKYAQIAIDNTYANYESVGLSTGDILTITFALNGSQFTVIINPSIGS